MGLLMLIYAVCATRTNLVYVLIFTSLIVVFSLLAATYWKLGQEDEVTGDRLTVVWTFLRLMLNVQTLICLRVLAPLCLWRRC